MNFRFSPKVGFLIIVFLALWDTFKAHGIAIPFPQREVRVIGLPEDTGTGLKVPTGLDPDGQSV